MKKGLLFYILVLIIGSLPMGVFASEKDFLIENGILVKYTGTEKIVVIPDSVTTIGEEAFAFNHIVESITIPKSVSEYGENAFVACRNLSQVIFEDGSKNITGDFYLCDKLTDIIIPSSVQSMTGTHADMVMTGPFYGTPWLENQKDDFVIVGDGVLMKYKGNQEEVAVPNNVKRIGTLAFQISKVKSVVLNDEITEIQPYAFAWSKVEKINFPNRLESIGSASFWMTPLNEAVIPQSVKSIGGNAFSGGIKKVSIYNTDAVIEENAFSSEEKEVIILRGYADSTTQKYVIEENIKYEGVPAFEFQALDTKVSVDAIFNKAKVLVNGVEKNFESYTINDNNYFKLRDLASVLSGTEKQFDVTWDGQKNVINLISNKTYTIAGGEMQASNVLTNQEAILSSSAIQADGHEVSLAAYNINDYNYFKLRDIAKVFNIGITWDEKTRTIGIDTAIGYSE